MRRAWPYVLCLMLVGCFAAPSRAEITVDEARAIAERVAGISLPDGGVPRPPPTDERVLVRPCTLVSFRHPGDPTGHTVDMTLGQYFGWTRMVPLRPDAPLTALPTAEEAIAQTKEEARRHLGGTVDAMAWTSSEWWGQTHDGVVEGVAPSVGDPPRRGLSWHVVALFSDARGMLAYRQFAPFPEEPVEIEVTSERALGIARERSGHADWGLPDGEPAALWQWDHRAWWKLRLQRPTSAEAPNAPVQFIDYAIDAVSGEILEEGHSM